MTMNYPVPRHGNFQSRVTKGKELLPGIDGRSKWARRLHDLCAEYVRDLGGQENVAQGQFTLIKAAATMTIILERQEVEFAKIGQNGVVSLKDLLNYQTVLNSLRRTLESLGLDRVNAPRDGGTGMRTYNLHLLTKVEQERLTTLYEAANKYGIEKLAEDQVVELHELLKKALPLDTNTIEGSYSR
ncbi:hypothetical protein LB534_14135 [Mesorhizobium sp. CA18]|uniref:hypothetical protein n=1 Tax=unclassified Mesorhizobium TaxID=325217 RepID=UPI001CCA5D6D|nr:MULTISPECIES: hypothetical protein [unclassified Mesorhizobium]MBZ9735587.1 hypothetical protein [Mesorhizobium sp. CA9]MBZ9826427.1 hypothetical protein [Mesorhizobium sp. CA18]MBZ9831550.1 hypothetical protein [Mesorhizobium sp. CA2]MBZ9837937.1 hypothetical protein [Mesorhizobium sp. CA3]MBZ9878537.1 hypothetical protein [Mesorhizobium sp. Ca11]